ncbi:MAG: 50S ribosomal protein L18 [Coxiellaceae bacterium]|nr:50S ribosomal protein L18 [Coxiellaceae bacterium]|tara:strand:- start:2186 stop:2551 length:366 start_codon:yes stop_codon:yes gene_type:complete
MALNKTKKTQRIRRGKSTRMHIRKLHVPRLCVHRTLQHIYAQVISADGSKVLFSASTADKALKEDISYGGNITSAEKVGALIAQKANEAGLTKMAFDRSGFKYHGRVKALAEAARKGGIDF